MTLPPKIATVPPESGGDCPPGFAGTGPLPVEAAATIGGTPHHAQIPSVILICRYTATTSPDSTTYRYVLSGSRAITTGIARPADDLMGVTVGTSRMPGVTCLDPTQSTYLARFSFDDGVEWYATATPFSGVSGNRIISGGNPCATGTGMQSGTMSPISAAYHLGRWPTPTDYAPSASPPPTPQEP